MELICVPSLPNSFKKMKGLYNLPKYDFNVFLLKESIANFSDAIRDDIDDSDEFTVRERHEIDGMLYVGLNKESTPKWNELLHEAVDDYEHQSTMSTRAVLFISQEDRIFAFTFGHGRHLLDDDSYVRGFGLRVLLNNAVDGSLKSVDTTVIDETPMNTTLQTSKSVLLSEFNITDIRTMFTSVTAESINKNRYGSIIKGKDSFAFSYELQFDELKGICTNLLEDYNDEKYKESFPDLDRMEEVSDPTTLSRLNRVLIERLKNEEIDSFHIPEIIEWESIQGFSFTPKGAVELDLSLDRFKKEKEKFIEKLTVDYMKNHRIQCVFIEEDENVKWTIYNCLQTEVQDGDNTYIFSIGNWFKIENDFINQVDDFVEKIEECQIEFPMLNGEHEKEANEIFEKELSTLLNLDRDTASIAGSQYEICDLLSTCKRFIHVKWWDSSATLSHLFSQGRVSGDILLNSSQQRTNLAKKLDEQSPEFLQAFNLEQYRSHEYTIVYAIIYPEDQTLVERLPFFSKINLRHSVTLLENMGYDVEIAHIETKQKRVNKSD